MPASVAQGDEVMSVFSVSLEWNRPPSEVCGDPPCIAVHATKEGAEARRLQECAQLEEDSSGSWAVYNVEVTGKPPRGAA